MVFDVVFGLLSYVVDILRVLSQLFIVDCDKGDWHLGQSTGTFGVNDGGCR